MADVLDVLIVGGGAAGYTAGIFAARDRCRALLLEKFSSGGQVLNCEHITNFPGFPQGVAGYTLGPLLQEQATAAGLQIAMNEVTAVHRDGDLLRIETDGDAYTTRTLIVASGSRFTTLGVPGEEEFLGRGLSHCAPCDGSFFMEKPVIVVGGGDAAVDEAIHLTQYASSVTVLHRRETLRACASLQERGRGERKTRSGGTPRCARSKVPTASSACRSRT
jgi:thioredoxin reductase (NADPH)